MNMTVAEYLNQAAVWVDAESQTVYQVDTMARPKRQYAWRQLIRTGTALISLAERASDADRNLLGTLSLVSANPRLWITDTPLYRALYRGDDDGADVDIRTMRTADGVPVPVPVRATEQALDAMANMARMMPGTAG